MQNSPQKSSRYEVRIAGSGGQGIILAGIMLAEAAILDGRYVAQSQNYGPEARGGNSISEVVVSDAEIDYPEAVQLDLLVALTQEGCVRNLPAMKENGLVIVDSSTVRWVPWDRVARLPFQQIARDVGERRAVNMAALGAVAALCPIVSPASLVRVMAKRLPPSKVEANRLAFNEALKATDSVKEGLLTIRPRDQFEL
ncbi:MAG: 2-oxoacid:acceptor oxidoreductase family protein [Dehalococcoidia bacterium]